MLHAKMVIKDTDVQTARHNATYSTRLVSL